MEKIIKLLEIENSELSKIVRSTFSDLSTHLTSAKNDYPNDPGILICNQILEEIDKILKTKPQPLNTRRAIFIKNHQETQKLPTLLPSSADIKELKLKKLWDELSSDRQLISYLDKQPQIQSQNDEQLWSKINFLLLRLPDNLAKRWQGRALEIAQQTGAKEDTKSIIKLPYIREEIIYPGLVEKIKAQGLSFSKQVNIDEQLTTNKSLTGDLDLLGRTVSTCIHLIRLDPCLHHTLKSVHCFGIVPLIDDTQRSKYIKALIDCFQRVERAETSQDRISSLKARLNLDEAIHSLVYQPPAHQDSWWSKLQQETRRTLITFTAQVKQVGHDVHIRPLSGLYADICQYSKDDLELDNGGNPGEVLICLRVHARINQEFFPGRVLYRSRR